MPAAVRTMWGKYRSVSEARIAMVDAAAHAALADTLNADTRRAAELAAHNLVGSLGTFGLPEGTRIAAELEAVLGSSRDIDAATARVLLERSAQLRRVLRAYDPSA
jgi:HPt (histidine-containing phosphotransfer) domain-containing protein